MSDQNWNGQGGYPQDGRGGYPQQGSPQQGGYPQQGSPQQGGYPQQGSPQQGGYPQQGSPQQGSYPQQGGYGQQGQGGGYPQGGYGQQGQPGHPQGPQNGGYQPGGGYGQQPPQGGGYPPTGNGSGGGSKLPWIIVGGVLLIAIIGLAVFLMTRQGGPSTEPAQTSASASEMPSASSGEETPSETPSPQPTGKASAGTPASTEPSAAETAPTGSAVTGEGAKASDMPESVGDWKRNEMGESLVFYTRGTGTESIFTISFGSSLDLKTWALGLDDPAPSADGTSVCGTVEKEPSCFVQTAKFGVISLSSTGGETPPADLTAFAEGFAKAMN